MMTESLEIRVNGMICPQCEDEIAHELLLRRGVVGCTVSYRKSRVTAEYDPRLISRAEIESALAEIGYPSGEGKSGLRSDIIAVIAVAALYFAVPALTGLVSVPTAGNGAGFGALFVTGMLTGVHCIGMCGGIMLSQGAALRYNGGRLLSYALMGALFGALGRTFGCDDETKSMIFTVCGLLVVLTGLKMWGVPFLRRLSPGLPKPCRLCGRAFAVGLLTGLMPCGALTSMWLLAASSGSLMGGALAMLAFGAGTCVFMLALGLFGAVIPKKYNKYLLKASTVFIVALGLNLMTKGLKLI